MYRRIAVLASLSVLGVMLLSGSAAQAATGDVVVCQFSGLSGLLSPAIQDIQSDVLEVIPDIERGTYSYGGPATCAGRAASGATAVDPATIITSNGQYSNLYCGTGLASDVGGTGTLVNFSAATNALGVADVSGIPYTVAFVGGTGPLIVGLGSRLQEGDITGITGTGTGVNPNPTRYTGGGLVNIVPRDLGGTGTVPDPNQHPYGNCANDPTREFEVTGGFVAVGTL